MSARLPRGFRRGHGEDLACPHRDVSTCPACAAEHEEIVEVYGTHYWIGDPTERGELLAVMAAANCPLCGSSDYSPLGSYRYHCNECGSEYAVPDPDDEEAVAR